MGIPNGTSPCPSCREKGRDTTGDNLVHYVDEDGNDAGSYCHACEYTVPSGKPEGQRKEKRVELEEKIEVITPEELEEIKENTTSSVSYRGIRKDTNAFFGVRYELSSDPDAQGDDRILKMYYPVTIKGERVGYKVRKHPKEFVAPVGYVGKKADFGGQFKFKACSRDLIIVGGEIDQLSAYQMLQDHKVRTGKTQYEPVSVVTSVIGEKGTTAQAINNYAFLNQFKRIILCLDNDDAGQEAMEKLIPKLPKGKVYVMNLELKDPNKYIEKGMEAKFVDAYFNAKQYVSAGIVTSDTIYDAIIETLATPKIPLPPFMKVCQNMMAGGIPLGYIVNLGAQSGIGKTSLVNEMIYYWIYESPHRVGIVSMELDKGQYGQVLLSRHIQQKIALIENPDEAVKFVQRDDIRAMADGLLKNEFGAPRFHLIDDRDGGIEGLKSNIEELIVSCDCKVIIFDPVSDILDGMSNDEQAVFMRWQKGMIKSHNVTFINISHVRKGAGNADNDPDKARFITEEDFSGSSTIFKSAGANILMMRNKYSEDDEVRNTTQLFLSKNRWAGKIGPAGELYYDNDTHMLHDKMEYFKGTSRPEKPIVFN